MRKWLTIWSLLFFVNAYGTVPDRDETTVTSGSEETVESSPGMILSTFPTELTVDGLLSLAGGNYCIQMGSFSKMENAVALSKKLTELLDIEVKMISESGLYKLFINYHLRGSAPCLYIPCHFPGPAGGDESDAVRTGEAEAEAEASGRGTTAITETVPESAVGTDDALPSDADTTAVADTSAVRYSSSDTLTAPAADTAAAKAEGKSFRPNLKNLFFLKGDSPWLTRYNYFGKSVALVNALIFTIIGSVATMLFVLVFILFNRKRMEKEEKLRQYLLEKYQTLIIDYLFGDARSDIFRPIASDFYRRQVLVEQLIDVSVNLKGDSGEKLTRLYRELELDKDSLRRARSRRWHMKIKGFRELAFMNIRDANDEMYKVLNSRNEILRMEAQIALVRLSDEDPFGFLSHLKRPFSLWEQITLHDLILHHNIPVPDFSRWLTSPNPTVVMFALRMIREFRQLETEQEVRKTLLHRDPQVSQLAVQVAGDLNMRTTLDTMKRMYKFQDYNNCLEIVRAMGKMPEMAMMGFLKLVLDKEDDVQLQIEAVKAIENMGEEGVKALVKVMKSEYKNYNIIVRHVLDRRIF